MFYLRYIAAELRRRRGRTDGGLSNRRLWADLQDGVPDGICLDAENAIWYGDVPNKRCVRGPANMADGSRMGQALTAEAPAPGVGWP